MSADCPFCTLDPHRIIWDDRWSFAIRDVHPVSTGHTLVIPRRHCATWFDATRDEQHSLLEGLDFLKRELDGESSPSGYNIGINAGAAAGQTIFHLHVHLIPRYPGDVPDPRGGVRHVIPARGNYLLNNDPLLARTPHAGALVRGDDDALLPHLRAHIDVSRAVDIAVAFVLQSGVDVLGEPLRDLLSRGGRLRILTGDYLDVTDPDALVRLLDLGAEKRGELSLRVFDGQAQSFHPKAYIFHGESGQGVAYVGSSNMSATALRTGVEWNMRTVSWRDRTGFADVQAAYERLFAHPLTQPLDERWVEAYRARRRLDALIARDMAVPAEPPRPPEEPHGIQLEALERLDATRTAGNRAGLVVLATGLGKTWLSAFDSAGFERVLFVAHREEILNQALATFRRIRPAARLGLYTGKEKVPDAEVVFASVQTLSGRLDEFPRDRFDYIVVDEFHHAAARTYRRLLDAFDPSFMLGLTATPERTDGGDLLGLCGENLVYRCDLVDGIKQSLLCPFEYYGVPDVVDYANIPWRNRRFDLDALEAAVATERRAANALDQWRRRAGRHGICFCVGQRHASYMSTYFQQHGLRAVAVHSGADSAPRATSLERLAAGELDVVCAVDMFNEGVDVPEVDTVMMLRPTESRVVWLQQLGRGLRRPRDGSSSKVLKVIDYIGNHRSFLMKPQALLGSVLDLRAWSHFELRETIEKANRGELDLPPGCSVTYDLETVDILRALLPESKGDLLRAYYEDFRDIQGARPTAAETRRDGFNPRVARDTHGTWLDFVRIMGDFSTDEQRVLDRHRQFLTELEKTPMTKSYKMLVLQAMLSLQAFPGAVALDALTQAFIRASRRSARLMEDIEADLDDPSAVAALLKKNPIKAWTGGKWFVFEGDAFRSSIEVAPEDRDAFVTMVEELVDWRLSDYLMRAKAEGEGMARLKVNHAGGRPILMLDRDRYPWLPRGWTEVWVEGQPYDFNFVKVAVNVGRDKTGTTNVLPDLLRTWYGTGAGLPSTQHYVELEAEDGRLQMKRADD